jgi:REP element-mobilizing transposase RayT
LVEFSSSEYRTDTKLSRLRQLAEKCEPHGPDVHGEAQKLPGQRLWARGYYVSTVGRKERIIREYIRKQESEDKRLEHMGLW